MIKKYFTYGHKNNSNDQKNCSNEAISKLYNYKFKLIYNQNISFKWEKKYNWNEPKYSSNDQYNIVQLIAKK